MTLQLQNTLTGNKDVFIPQQPDVVTLYTCGPTVYNEPHLGNWVAFIRWDVLVRTLRMNGFNVNRVMNITDVGHLTSDADEGEDKMQKGARREGITEWEVAERYTNRFLEGMTQLGMLPPEHMTKATEHIDIQIRLVKTLEDKGFTYVLADGVYFDTAKFPAYADFAHLDLEAQRAGARVEFNTDKHNASDFVLWRLTPAGETRNMEWDSPWGRGIPGWHLECSAMAMEYLGNTLDIHTGGIDHIPVHHTNEIAQSEAASGQRFANFWVHANFLTIDGTKISKSLQNDVTLSDLSEHGFSPMDFRMFILQSHYATESNFTWENLGGAHNRLKRWRDLACLRHQTHDTLLDDDEKDDQHDANGVLLAAKGAVLEAVNDDLGTPQALVATDKAFDTIEATRTEKLQHSALIALLETIDDLFGLQLLETTPDISDEAKQQLLERANKREQKDWAASDVLRDQLAAQGIGINDTPHGARWFWL